MKLTKKCYGCKQDFRREELVDYASPMAKTMQSYCPKCLAEKQAREKFSNKVCMIFGIKSPGPRIWTERKRLIETYGYTDDIIVDCLEYIYIVEKKKKFAESLCLVNPPTVEKMKRWKTSEEYKARELARAVKMQTREYIVPIKENTTNNKEILNADDYLEEE